MQWCGNLLGMREVSKTLGFAPRTFELEIVRAWTLGEAEKAGTIALFGRLIYSLS